MNSILNKSLNDSIPMKKNIFKYIGVIAVFLILGACSEDFLIIPPADNITADNFYKTEADVRANTASLYGMPWFEFNDVFFWCAGDLMSGDVYHNWDQEGQFFFFTFNEGNTVINAGWNGLFRVLSYANSVINDLPPAASAGGVPGDVIDRAVAEGRFVRAMVYFLAAEFWGEVPIIENSTELVTSNNMIIPKNTRTSIYEFIKRDLEFAIEKLPTSDDPGRVTQWSAKGLMAKLYITWAQETQSAEYFNLARDYALDVIENSGLELVPNYGDLFTIAGNNSPESLFAMQFMANGWGFGNSRQARYARSSIITGNTQAWGGGKCMTHDFLQDVEPGDARRQHIYMLNGDFHPEINSANGGYTYEMVSREPDGTQIEGATPLLNSLKKWVIGSSDDFAGIGSNQDVAINQYLLRLADVYLIYAEAVLGTSDLTTDAKALEYFNDVRIRARLEPVDEISFLDIIRERRVEFGLEAMNWFDIKRYYYRDPVAGLAYLNNQTRAYTYVRITGDDAPDENTYEGYELTPPDAPVITYDQDMFLPIPTNEVVNNPLLAPGVDAVDYYAE